MTNKLRTLLFTLGSTTAVVAPIAAVVACGDDKSSPVDASKPFALDGSGSSKSSAHPIWKGLYEQGVKEGYTFTLAGSTVTLTADQAAYVNGGKTSQPEFVARVINLFTDGTVTHKFDTMLAAAGFNATSFHHGTISVPAVAAPQTVPTHVATQPVVNHGPVAPVRGTALSAGTIDLALGDASWHKLFGAAGATPIAAGTKVGIMYNSKAYEAAFSNDVEFQGVKAGFKGTTLSNQEADFATVAALIVGGDLRTGLAISFGSELATTEALFKNFWDQVHAGNPSHATATFTSSSDAWTAFKANANVALAPYHINLA